ncbi:hypothetical protein KEM55_001572 [Ascosphaera atra]|nr:hypothetical protein KEM55_001572 [Ascosphaera atra]
MIFAGANVTYTSEGIQEDTFYEALGKFHEFLPSLVDHGATAVYFMTASSFAASPITAPGLTSKELEELLKPYTQALDELGVKYKLSLHQSQTYLDYFEAMQQTVPVGVANFGSWLVPRSVVEEKGQDLVDVMREVIEQGAFAGGVALNVSTAVAGDVDNAVLPAWRDALVHWMVATPWSFEAPRIEMEAWQTKMTEQFIPRIKALAPGSGAYMNEADFNQPDFKSAFYGKNYERLKEIKRKYDPHDIFWALTAVGSDDWVQRQDGRLCRV